jgi:hypothetical protein
MDHAGQELGDFDRRVNTQKIPFRTRRSSTRGTPRGLRASGAWPAGMPMLDHRFALSMPALLSAPAKKIL